MNANILKLASVIETCVLCGIVMNAIPNTVQNIPVGDRVLFPVTLHDKVQYEVTVRRSLPISIKILAWRPSSSEIPYIVHPLYQHRVEIYLKTFVMLKNVCIDDSGEYEIQTNYFERKLINRDQSIVTLQVYEPVSQPKVTIHGNCGTASNITLKCSVSSGTDVMFHWVKDQLSVNNTYDETELVIDCFSAKPYNTYMCTALNPISNATSDPVSLECFLDNETTGNRSRWVVIVSFLIVILVLTSIGYLLYKHNKNNKITFLECLSRREPQ